MARSRNIKPGFFVNENMADNAPLGRLLFIGLTTIADYKGELEWRPKRIKAQLLPYDDCDINELAINLDNSGFIRFYSGGDITYVKIVNFDRHQNPHKNEREAGSDIPSFSESMRQAFDFNRLAINLDNSGLNRDKDGTARADSLNLIPDSLTPVTASKPVAIAPKFSDDDMRLARFIRERILSIQPKAKEPNFEKWANTIRLMREQDNRTHKQIQDVFLFANKDSFWAANIMSPEALRKQMDKLEVKMKSAPQAIKSASMAERMAHETYKDLLNPVGGDNEPKLLT